MSDTEIVDFQDNEVVTFLPGGTSNDKEALYGTSSQRMAARFACTKVKAALTVGLLIALIVAVALIAAFSKSACPPVSETQPTTKAGLVSHSTAVQVDLNNFPWKDIRLPTSVQPDTYTLEMTTDLENFIFSGVVRITLKVTKEVDFIVLHSKNLNISNVRLSSSSPQDPVNVMEVLEYQRHQQLYLKLSRNLVKKHAYTLSLHFAGTLNAGLTGYYRSSYKNERGETRWLSVTQFESTYARTAFPCFDEPSFKANFTLSMTHDNQYIALFNMPQKSDPEPAGGHMVTSHFETSVKMSSYLVAFIVCDYGKVTDTSHKYTVSVYAPKHQINQAHWALHVAVKVLPFYEDFFGQPYPLPKQDLIAIPDFESGAMENWGLITYRMVSILYDPDTAIEQTKERVAIVVAHELGHQWFGNLVTMEWWNDLWLNEGFASYLEVKGVDHVKPDWGMDYKYISKIQYALQLDSLVHSHPISVNIEDPDEISSIFDSISYDKGSSLIRMMASFLGHSVLTSGLQSYLDKYKYGNARTVDLWNSLKQAYMKHDGGSLDIPQIMDTWTKQMGYPLITVHREGDTVSATQKRFYLRQPSAQEMQGSKSPYPGGYSWHVPLTYLSQGNTTNQLVWMPHGGSTPTTFHVEGNWFKININQVMYYRVNYDNSTWRALTHQLNENHTVLTPSCRSSLIDDAFSLSRSGHLDSDVALNLTMYVSRDRDYLPWSIVTYWFKNILSIVVDDQHLKDLCETYMKQQMKPVLSWMGDTDVGSHLTRLLRSKLFGYGVGFNETRSVSHALDLFKKWMTDNKSIPVQLKPAVLEAGIIYGGEREWNYCWSHLVATHNPSDAMLLRRALAMSSDSNILKRYLSYALQPDKIKSQDGVYVIQYIAANPAGRTLAWNFIKQNWSTLYAMYRDGPFILDDLIKGVISLLSSDKLYTEVQQFFDSKQLSSHMAVQQGLELIKIHADWRRSQVPVIRRWLEGQVSA